MGLGRVVDPCLRDEIGGGEGVLGCVCAACGFWLKEDVRVIVMMKMDG